MSTTGQKIAHLGTDEAKTFVEPIQPMRAKDMKELEESYKHTVLIPLKKKQKDWTVVMFICWVVLILILARVI